MPDILTPLTLATAAGIAPMAVLTLLHIAGAARLWYGHAQRWRLLRRAALRVALVLAVPTVFAGLLRTSQHQESMSLQVYAPSANVVTENMDWEDIVRLGPGSWQRLDAPPAPIWSLAPRRLWLRVPLPKPDSSVVAPSYVAEVSFGLLDTVSFAVLRNGQLRGGSYHGLARRADFQRLDDSYPTYDFTIEDGDLELLVEVVSAGVLIAPLKVQRKADYNASMLHSTVIQLLMLGGVFGSLLFNLSLFISLKEPLYSRYVLFQVPLIIGVGSYCGLVPRALVASFGVPFVQQLSIAGMLATLATLPHFMVSALQIKSEFPWMHRAMRYGASMGAFALLASFFMTRAERTILTATVVGAFTIAALLQLSVIAIRDHALRVLFGLTGLGSGIIITIAALGGFLTYGKGNLVVLCAGVFWDAILVSVAISWRVGGMRNARTTLLDRLIGVSTLATRALTTDPEPTTKTTTVQASVLVLDIAHYSLVADRLGSIATYKALSARMKALRDIIGHHGGTIDRSMGDGLLGFFTANGQGSPHQACAFAAAVAMQELALTPLALIDGQRLFLPLRIGLHVDSILIANLSGQDRLDFALVGHGVQWTQHLETCAAPFRIMMSSDFRRDLIANGTFIAQQRGLHRIQIPAEQAAKLVQAHEFDPFHKDPALARGVEREFASFLGWQRAERTPPRSDELALKTAYGILKVRDVALHGLGARGSIYLARRVIIETQVETPDDDLRGHLQARLLTQIHLEVRWSMPGEDGSYEHGFRFVGLNMEQRHYLLTTLTRVGDSASTLAVS